MARMACGVWVISIHTILSGLSHDAPGFLCSHAQANVTLLALGPLTNIAQAVQSLPDPDAALQDHLAGRRQVG